MGALNATPVRLRLVALAAGLCASTAWCADGAPDRLLSARSLWPAWLDVIDAQLTVSAEQVQWRGQTLDALELPVSVAAGVVDVRGASARLAGGEVALDAGRDAEGAAHLKLVATHVTLGELAALRPYVSGVPVDVEMDLRGDGASVQAFAASATGTLRLRNTGAGIVRHGFEEVGDNLVSHFIGAFEVFRRAGSDAQLECVAMDLPFVQGVAVGKKSMELRTRRLWVRGGGSVDMRNESVDLVFKPETRGRVRLQSLKVVERVRVHGPLRAPEVTLDSAHLVGRAARLGLDVANLSGGVVLNRLLRRKPPPSLCGGAPAAPSTKP